jgi:signal transduction histidine kinase/DNA-binding NarL/FixJ family response regulator
LTIRTPEQATGMEAVTASGGDAGRLIEQVDWSRTALGPMSGWPQSLRSAVSICLLSRFPMTVWWGPELVFIFNDAYRPLLGVKDPAAVMGQAGRNVWPEIWEVIGPMLHGVFMDGDSTLSEDQLLLLDRNGYLEECYFTYSFSPIHDETGGIGGIFTAVIENTQRVIGERRLRTLSDVAENMSGPHGIEGVCERAVDAMARNPADIPFAALYLVSDDGSEVSLKASTGHLDTIPALPRAVHLDQDTDSVWLLSEVITSGEPRQITLRPGGSATAGDAAEHPHSSLILPILHAGEVLPSGVVVVGASPRRALDVEYRRFFELLARQIGSAVADARAYDAERRRAEALADLDRAKTDFFSNVSHEFRTPLALLLGPLEQALTLLPSEQRGNLEIAHRNALRLLRLVNALLDFSRIGADRIAASYEPVDFSQLSGDLASAFRAAVEAAGLDLVVDCPPLAEPAYLDIEMWEKVVLNLMSNAFKFTLEGAIEVRTRLIDGRFQLTVADTGVGIPHDELPRLFDRFYRIRGTRSRSHEGTGIGLALVQELVGLHGGEIHVDSTPSKGTTFTVSIPTGAAHLPADRMRAGRSVLSTSISAAPFVDEAQRWLPDSAPSRASAIWSDEAGFVPTEPGAIQGARVLVVDDNADMRQYLIGLLSPYWNVEAVGDGEAALKMADRARPDLVLTDVMMPGMGGFGLLRALRSRETTRDVPIVMLSARAGDEATVEGLDAGADDYLVKPFAARELIARVRANLELSKMRTLTQTTIARYGESERALQRALSSLAAVAQHIRAGVDLPTLLGRLSETVAELVGSKRAVFWRLDDGEIRGEPEAYGFDPEMLSQMRIRVSQEGDDLVDRIVFKGEVFNARIDDDEQFAPYRDVLSALQARDAIGVPWRAGDQPLGVLAVYDSMKPAGFTQDDVWVLRIAALAAALVWEHKKVEDDLATVSAREAVRLSDELTRAAGLEKTKSEFLRLASHELRAPITVLAGYVSLMKNGLLGEVPDQIGSVLPVLDKRLREMRGLVDQMLETARLEDDRLALNVERLDLREVVTNAAETMSPLIPASHRLRISLPKRSVPVSGDAGRLGTVIANLIDNAVRYSPDGGTVKVRCIARAKQGQAVVEVRDEGLGIAPDDLPRLFTRFGRIVTPDNSHISGTGLGLYLSNELIAMHGGSISVLSEPRKGSTFAVTLPLVAGPSETAERRSVAASSQG